jgi:hypothetical protein
MIPLAFYSNKIPLALVHLKNPTYVISPIALFSSGLKTVVKRQQN